jgi:hypothetical protein
MNKQIIILLVFLLCCWPGEAKALKCFFESDCPKDDTCVTPKGSLNGVCQPKKGVVPQVENILGSKSIISDQGKCTFNTDCPDGGQCVKQPGALYGTCQGSGYAVGNLQAERGSMYKDKSCFFNQDCKIGQVCVKPQGAFKGVCEDDLYQSNKNIKDAKDPRSLLQTFRSSDRQCLVDQDCFLREVCLKQERTVFGICRAKSSVPVTSSAVNSSTNSSLFSNSNSLFNK